VAKRTLLLGRAGSGKTRSILDRLIPHLSKGRESGALLLVPTLSQANHLKRLLLSRRADLPGFFDRGILTFTGLAELLLPGRSIRELLSGMRQDLLIRQVLLEGRTFAGMGRWPGFRRAALELLKELKQSGLPPSEIEAHLARLAAGREGAAAERLTTFGRLFAGYAAACEAEGLLDHEDLLREARDALLEDGAGIALRFMALDGFQNFTGLEREILLLLADRAEETVVTLCYDPALEREEGRHLRVCHETSLFLIGKGFRREILEGNRRARSPALAALEERLFDEDAAPIEGPAGDVVVLQGADPEDEADRVARTVLRLVREESRRYRDIVVVVRDARAAKGRFQAAFDRHRLPLRVYAEEELGGAPYLRAALGLLQVAAGRIDRERIVALLRADAVATVRPADVDRMEEALLTEPEPATLEDWADFAAKFSDGAGRLLAEIGRDSPAGERPAPDHPAPDHLAPDHLAPDHLAPDQPAPDHLAEEVVAFTDRLLVPLWRRDRSEPARIAREALAYRAFRRTVLLAARSMPSATDGEGGDLADLLPLLGEALSRATTAPRDRRLSVVNLIDAREARQWEAPVVIVSGLVEGEFPRRPREDIFLSDGERRKVNRETPLGLREHLLLRDEERFLFYVAMTRARERLYLTWPVTDGRGEETLRSPFLEEALRLLPGGDSAVSRRRLSDALPDEGETACREDLRRRALDGLSGAGLGGGGIGGVGDPVAGDPGDAAALNDLLLSGDGVADGRYARAVRVGARFLRPPRAVLTGDAPLSGIAERPRSPSALEDFAQCPFRHFARRTLGLVRIDRPLLDPLALGEIVHEALRLLFDGAGRGESFSPAALTPEATDAALARALGDLRPSGLREARVLAAARTNLLATVESERGRLAGSEYRPTLLEEPFGGDERPLRFDAEDGRSVEVRGRVDRVDVAPDGRAVVIDYKSGKAGFDAKRKAALAEGASLQLPLYLAALRGPFGLEPAGAYYLPLGTRKLGGYAREGEPVPRGSIELGADALDDLLSITAARVVEIDRRILAGEIEVRPRDREQCRWCEMKDLCRVERGRKEPS